MSPQLTLTIAEAAEALGISKASAYKRAKDGSLPTVRLGRLLLVPVSRLEEMLNG